MRRLCVQPVMAASIARLIVSRSRISPTIIISGSSRRAPLRAAEKLFFNHLSTGASDDLARTTDIARSMVTRYGMDADIGHIVHEDNQQNQLGQYSHPSAGRYRTSNRTAEQIDNAVKKIVDTIFDQTFDILEKNKELMDKCAQTLLKKETLNEAEILELTGQMYRVTE